MAGWKAIILLVLLATEVAGQEVRVNAGGSNYTEAGGRAWSGSGTTTAELIAAGFSGATAFGSVGTSIDDTSDDDLYATGIYCNSSCGWSTTVASGIYRVRLLWAETQGNAVGRTFNVIEGGSRIIVSQMDVRARAGATYTAYERDLLITIPGNNLDLTFAAVGGSAFVNAIEVIRVGAFTSGNTNPTNCGEGEFFYNTDDDELKICTAEDTWETLSGGGGGGGSSVDIEENNVKVIDADDLTGIDFLGADFDVTDSSNEADVAIAAAITRDAEWDTIGEIETATSTNIIVSTEIDSESEFETIVGVNYAKTSDNVATATALAANPASLTDQFCIDRNADGSCATAGDLDDLQGTIATAQLEDDAVSLAKLDDGSDTPSAGQVLVVASGDAEVEYVAQSTLAAGTAAALANNPAALTNTFCLDRAADGSCAGQGDLDDLGGTVDATQVDLTDDYDWTGSHSFGSGAGLLEIIEGTAPGAGGSAGVHNVYINSTSNRLSAHENGGSAVQYVATVDIDTASEINTLTTDADFATLTGAETLATGTKTVTAKFDFGGGTLEIPNSGTLPGTCAVGEAYMDTDATSGQRFYLCESSNTWTLQGDGDSGGGGGGGGDGDITLIASSVTANTNGDGGTATHADVTVPADTFAAGDTVRVTAVWTKTGTTDTWNPWVAFGASGESGTGNAITGNSAVVAGTVSVRMIGEFQVLTSSTQDGFAQIWKNTNVTVLPDISQAEDVTAETHFYFRNTCTSASDDCTLVSYTIERLRDSAGAEVNDLEGDGASGIADTEIPIGTGAGTVNYAALSGDATMSNAGVVTVANDSHAHTASTISGLDAADTTTGTFDDARLPAEVSLTDEANTFTALQTFAAGIATGDGTIPGSHHFYETSANGDNYYRVVGDPDIGSNGCAILPDDGTGADGEALLFTSATQTVDGDTCREMDTVDVATQGELDAHDHNGGDGAQIPAGGISSVDGDTATIQLRRASDCTAETGGLISEQCVDSDDGAMFVCVPSAGTCDTSGEWIEVGGGGGGGGASELDDLSDVTLTTETTDDVLKYSGSAWVNTNLLTAIGEDLATTNCLMFESSDSVGCDADATFNGDVLHLGTGSTKGIRFGDDDSGIREDADDTITIFSTTSPLFSLSQFLVTVDFSSGSDWQFTSATFGSKFTNGTPVLANPSPAVTTPAYTFLGDTNTGMYWISADTVGLAAGGTKVAGFGVNGLQLADPGTKPTCDSSVRGVIWHEFGGAGVADTVEVCSKDSGDAYAWRTLQ